MKHRQIKVGDWITFTATHRCGRKKVKRKVVDLDHRGYPEVRYMGWDRFVVGCFPGDIIHKVERA